MEAIYFRRRWKWTRIQVWALDILWIFFHDRIIASAQWCFCRASFQKKIWNGWQPKFCVRVKQENDFHHWISCAPLPFQYCEHFIFRFFECFMTCAHWRGTIWKRATETACEWRAHGNQNKTTNCSMNQMVHWLAPTAVSISLSGSAGANFSWTRQHSAS